MRELRGFQRETRLLLLAALFLVSGALVVAQQGRMVSGVISGGLLGLANLAWMVGTAIRLMGSGAGGRAHTFTAFVRFVAVGALLGGILVVGRVNPVGALIGYGLFPIAAAVAGWRTFRPVEAVVR